LLFPCGGGGGGGHSDSPFNSEGALERAKRSVERHYAVVGVLEDFNVTLTVFEHYVPRFFRGASDVYYGKRGNAHVR